MRVKQVHNIDIAACRIQCRFENPLSGFFLDEIDKDRFTMIYILFV